MGLGSELILGFPYKNKKLFRYFCKNIFVTTNYRNFDILKILEVYETSDFDNAQDYKDYDHDNQINEKITKKLKYFDLTLRKIHKKCLSELGFKNIKDTKDDYLFATTKCGKREFYPFRLTYYLDECDMGEGIDELIIGISISGWGRPVLADYKDPSGGIYPIIFDKKLKSVMAIAKKLISKEIPVFKRALWCVKEMHY